MEKFVRREIWYFVFDKYPYNIVERIIWRRTYMWLWYGPFVIFENLIKKNKIRIIFERDEKYFFMCVVLRINNIKKYITVQYISLLHPERIYDTHQRKSRHSKQIFFYFFPPSTFNTYWQIILIWIEISKWCILPYFFITNININWIKINLCKIHLCQFNFNTFTCNTKEKNIIRYSIEKTVHSTRPN